MNWTAAEQRHDFSTPEGVIFESLRDIEKLRAEHRAFDSGADVWIVNTRCDAVLGIGRYYKGEKIVALFNFSDYSQNLSLDELGDYSDLLTGAAMNKFSLNIASGSFMWLVCDFGEEF